MFQTPGVILMRNQFYVGVAFAALMIPASAFAQSTGTIDAEEEIVVTASKTEDGLNGVIIPDSPKARTVLTQELIGRQGAGQSVLNTINLVPGVNFTNNDPYGSSGGNIRIRGFDGNRVSLTFDGIPLNDTGNYAIFSNQQLDPEIIEQVNVNQGTTDVDSPTASAAGGTVNYRTRIPSEELGGIFQVSAGRFDYSRVFGMLDSGSLTAVGTRLFVAASFARNDKFKGPGRISKQQYNARLYQPIGEDGDFISISGHYNQNRNNNYRALTLAQARADLFDNGNFDLDFDATCTRLTPLAATGTPGVQNEGTVCGNYVGTQTNPSNTGNVRINSKFSLAENVTLTVDPSFQYVLATGGGQSTLLSEGSFLLQGVSGLPGRDLNGDTDTRDTIRVHAPSVTNTRRYGVLASLRWDVNDNHYVRMSYAYDRGNHRQTGPYAALSSVGDIVTPFGGRSGTPIRAQDGFALQTRDRLSIALLNQISGEYRGKFLEEKLTVVLGLRAPFFKRELNQFCYTLPASGNPVCTSLSLGTTPVPAPTPFLIPSTSTAPFPLNGVFAPFKSTYKYDKLLPNVGFTVKAVEGLVVAGNFSKGFSAPRTDNLYRAPIVSVKPETTDNFDLAVRYADSTIQASVSGFLNKFKNRIQSSFDADSGITVDRSIGDVDIKGVEGSFDVRPLKWFFFRGIASYTDAKLKGNIPVSATVTLPTAGKFLAETPKWQYGYYAQMDLGPASVGLNFKHVGKRYATDLNDVSVAAYDSFDADARIDLKAVGLEKSYLQLNVFNLFNKRYLGSISSRSSAPINNGALPATLVPLGGAIPGGSDATFFVNSPRTIQATIRIGF
jgi:iron complex outermembrane recepter protein